MGEQQVCADCNARSPLTETNYTLIGAGWRLTRTRVSYGKLLIEWRCPVCWKAFKEGGGEVMSPASSRAAIREQQRTSGTHAAAPPVSEDDAPTIVDRRKASRRSSRRPPRQGGR
jgi:hypothetical protein